MHRNHRLLTPALIALIALALVACGGGSPGAALTTPSASTSTTPLRTLAAAVAAPDPVDTTALLNWAEREYPQFFPGRQVNQESPPYTYRHYPATGNHVGVAGDDVYILGPVSGGLLKRVGSKEDFRCRVLPAECPSTHARAGWTARLSTLQHGVSGTVTIIDARTLRLSGFNYDGGGPQVYAYLGSDDTTAAFTAGKPIGPRLNSPFAYADATIDLQLPEGQTLDGFAAVSIWCAEFGVNFGSGLFAPPRAGAH
jgi:Electron transfer DM13